MDASQANAASAPFIPDARKYPRTLHFPFSPGTQSDDRIALDVSALTSGGRIVITEKLDGENTCLNARGVFARSHGAPTRNPWASYLAPLHARLQPQLRSLELFGESVYAVHSIRYGNLDAFFYLFAIRDGDRWLGWEEVSEYAELIDVPTVPVLYEGPVSAPALRPLVEGLVSQPSRKSPLPPLPPSPIEGVVARIASEFDDVDFSHSVFKWVRRGHVQTDQHWIRNWQRAYLGYELERMGGERASDWLTGGPGGDTKR